jgi:hypothetical protein
LYNDVIYLTILLGYLSMPSTLPHESIFDEEKNQQIPEIQSKNSLRERRGGEGGCNYNISGSCFKCPNSGEGQKGKIS